MTLDPPLTEIERVARDWLVRIQLGDASGAEDGTRDRIAALVACEAWRDADPAHAAALARIEAALGVTDVLKASRLVSESRLRRQTWPHRHPLIVGAMAAGLVATLALGTCARFGVFGAERGPDGAVTDMVYATPIGETRTVMLADGTSVYLDPDTLLRVDYSARERRVRLDRGRARFTVVHNAERPFRVDAGGATVVDLGTVFDVAVGQQGVRVALLRGSVEVRARDCVRVASRRLVPGQEISFNGAMRLPDPEPVAAGGLDWVSGRLAFRDVRLADALVEINRYNARQIGIADPALGERRISGGFDGHAPDAFAHAVAQILGLRVASGPGNGLIMVAGSSHN